MISWAVSNATLRTATDWVASLEAMSAEFGYSFPGSAWERTFPKLCFDTCNWKRSFRKVPSQAEPGTESQLIRDKLNDSCRVSFARLILRAADSNSQFVFTDRQVGVEHDCAGIVESGAEAVIQVAFLEGAAIDTRFDDARVWTRDDECADRSALEWDDGFGSHFDRAEELN